jgi:hypothetical protein
MNQLFRAQMALMLRSRDRTLGVIFLFIAGVCWAYLRRARGADALLGPISTIVLPLWVYAICERSFGAGGFARAQDVWSALGVPRTRAASGQLGALLGTTAIGGAVYGMCCALAAHGPAQDAVICTWTLGLGAAAYAALFAFASTWITGRGMGIALGVVFFFGGPSAAFVWLPTGHITRLLGGAPVATLHARASCAALVVLIAIFAGLSIWRAARTPKSI